MAAIAGDGPARSPYAPFLRLPAAQDGAAATAFGGSSAATVSLPLHLRADERGSTEGASEGGRVQHTAAFALAREVLEEHERWAAGRAAEVADRRERQAVLACLAGEAPTPTSGEPPRAAQDEGQKCPGCGYTFLMDDSDYCRKCGTQRPEAAPATATATTAGTSWESWGGGRPAGPDEVVIELHLPNGARAVETFNLKAGSFDIYSKVYSHLEHEGRDFEMCLTGGTPPITKKLDEATWEFTLGALGLKGGATYEVAIKHK